MRGFYDFLRSRVLRKIGFDRTINSQTITVLTEDKDGNILEARGTALPTTQDGQAGYAKGATYTQTDIATGQSAVYENIGTTSSSVFSPSVMTATVTLTSAQVKALRATPITLVAAKGAGKIIEFVAGQLILDYGSNAFTESTANLAVRIENGSGVIVSQAIESTGFIDQTADTITNALPKIDAIVAAASFANKGLVLHNTGAGEIAGNAADDSVLNVKVTYRVHSTGL